MSKFGNKIASAAVAVMLAAGMIPYPAFAIEETRGSGGDAAVSSSGVLAAGIDVQATSGQLTRKETGNAAPARAVVAAAKARVEAARVAVDNGSFGFFSSVGATEALDALRTHPMRARHTKAIQTMPQVWKTSALR